MTVQQHLTWRSAVIDADAETAYRLVENVAVWPALFGPTVYVRPLACSATWERFRIWASVNGEIVSWTSLRTLDLKRRCINFAQEQPRAPLASIGGRWEFRPTRHGGTEVALHHYFRTVDDSPESVEWVRRALERNSSDQLAELCAVADGGQPIPDVLFTLRHRVTARGSVADAYDFVNQADRWPARLPHVMRVRLAEQQPRVQELQMVTRLPGGGAHETKSIRVCLANELIAFKQSVLPAPLMGHSGLWSFGPDGDDVVIESRHTVLLDRNRVRDALGSAATLADARVFTQDALKYNSRVTLLHAKEFAERARCRPASEDAR